jgi:hypothetical protein
MISIYMTRLEIEEEQIAFVKSLSIYEEGEIDKPSEQTEDILSISDTEEDKEVSTLYWIWKWSENEGCKVLRPLYNGHS